MTLTIATVEAGQPIHRLLGRDVLAAPPSLVDGALVVPQPLGETV